MPSSRGGRRAYLGALVRLDVWRGTAPVDDASLAVYIEHTMQADPASQDRLRKSLDGFLERNQNRALC